MTKDNTIKWLNIRKIKIKRRMTNIDRDASKAIFRQGINNIKSFLLATDFSLPFRRTLNTERRERERTLLLQHFCLTHTHTRIICTVDETPLLVA